MPELARGIFRRFVVAAVGISVLIAYGSLYPFHFQNGHSNEPFRTLIGTWRTPTGRGDLLANILLYFPLGFVLFSIFERLRRFTRFIVVIGAGLALSTGLELAQTYAPGRDSAMADVYANTAGTILGAVGSAMLFSKRRLGWPPIADRRPYVILLLCSWLGYRLAPFAPTIDLHKYWDALKPLVLTPALPWLSLYRHTVIVLVVAVTLEALLGVARSRFTTLALIFGVLLARILIIDTVLSPAEVVGGALGVVTWHALLSRWRYRARVVTALFAGVVVMQALEPFQFTSPARPFGWIPFLGFMQGSVEVNVRSFFEKAFTYGALIWLTIRAGVALPVATGISAAFVLGLRLVQTFLPGRSAEVTDVILVLMMAAAMTWMGENPARDSIEEQRAG